MNNKTPMPRREKNDMISQKLFTIEFEEGNKLGPCCFLDDRVMQTLRAPWVEFVIVKLLVSHEGATEMGVETIRRIQCVMDIGPVLENRPSTSVLRAFLYRFSRVVVDRSR